ncbi:MAG: phenylalanine--tRNA ligase subunit beta [Clostridia bacterium]|nr:phenylalanine--tRNA ligase subunit beta [Clostridia bacterium]
MFKFSLNWLRDYCGKDANYDDIMKRLKTQGFEFDGNQEVKNDIITAIEVKANRPDMLYHMGIAREIKAFDGEPVPTIAKKQFLVNNSEFPIKIDIDNSVCKRFCAVKISGVNASAKVPDYIKDRLEALGINSVNAVVDIGNYTMIDIGQPIHAYDAEKIVGNRLAISKASEEAEITTFSGETSEIKTGDIVISDGENIKCVAGIIGTDSAAVKENTKDIILEAAVFDEVSVRLTSRRLRISTPSSFRFERGVDADSTFDALLNCAEMITKICGGKIEMPAFDSRPEKSEEKFVNLSVRNSNRLIGISLDQKTVINCLEKYNFKCEPIDEDLVKVSIPSYRLDVLKEVDLIEEVARIYGYDNIDPVMPTIMTSYNKNEVWSNMDVVREVLGGLGFGETINYSFIPADTMKIFGIEDGEDIYSDLKIQNPIAGAYSLMRPMMTYSLLNCLAYNYSINNSNLALFELGRVYFKDKSFDTGVREVDTCGFIMSGVRIPRGFGSDKDIKYSYYDLLNYLSVIMNRFGQSFKLQKNEYKFLEEGSGYNIIINGEKIGFIGEINKSKLSKVSNLKLVKDKIFYGEFYIGKLAEKVKKIKFESKYPPIKRLYNLVQRKDITAGQVKTIIEDSSDVVRDVVVKDIYSDKNFAETEHAVLYEVNYCSKDHTLTSEEIEKIEKEFLDKLNSKFAIKFKS